MHVGKLPIDAFPHTENGRRVFVQGLAVATRRELEERGYEVTELASMPRSTIDEELLYLEAKSMAFEMGTVDSTSEDRRCLELRIKQIGHKQSEDPDLYTMNGNTLDLLIGWSNQDNTLAGQSTVQSAQDWKVRSNEGTDRSSETGPAGTQPGDGKGHGDQVGQHRRSARHSNPHTRRRSGS